MHASVPITTKFENLQNESESLRFDPEADSEKIKIFVGMLRPEF